MNFKYVITLFGGLFALSSAANASDPLGVAGTFNDFILGQASVSGGGEAQGAIAVGGIGLSSGSTAFYAANNYNVDISDNQATVGSYTNVGFYVNGNVDFANGGQLNSGSNGYVSGNFNTGNPFDLNGGGQTLNYGGTLTGTVQGGSTNHANLVSPSVFTTAQTSLQSISAAIAALTPTAGLLNSSDPNNWSLNIGTHSSPTTYVLDLTATQLANNVTLSLGDLSSSDTLLINVTGGSVSNFGVSINANGLQNQILWNFDGAGSFNVNNRQMEGSLLAPLGTVDQSQVIEGNLIADQWNMTNGVENHSFNFDGSVPQPTPEPMTYALGLGAVGLFVRRRIAKK